MFTAVLIPDPATHTMPWLWLAIAGILNSIIALYYYLRVAGAMFLKRSLREIALERAGESIPFERPLLKYAISQRVLLFVFVIPVIALGVFFQPLIDFASGVIRFFNFENIKY